MFRKYCIALILMLNINCLTAQELNNQKSLIGRFTKKSVETQISQKSGLIAAGNFIKLTILGNNLSDSTLVGFYPNATTSLDTGLDSLKAINTNTSAPVISSVSGNLDYYANYLPSNINVWDIAIRVTVGATGKYVLLRDSSLILPQGACMFLEDVSMNYMLDFVANASYSFSIEDTTVVPRFVLHITEPVSAQSTNTSCFYTQNGTAIVVAPSIGSYSTTWMDNLGNTLTNHVNVSGNDSLKNLAPGKYPFMITSSLGACLNVQDTVFVTAASAININAVIKDEKCQNSNTGQINASNISGGTGPFTYAWSNGSISSINNQLNAGVYILYLTDANGCKDTSIYSVQQLSNLNAAFTTSTDTVFMSNPIVNFTNQSSGYTTLLWDFGDGNTSNSNNPSHQYQSPGTYTVELNTSDNYCIEKSSKIVWVLNPTGISSDQVLSDQINIICAGDFLKVRFNLMKEETAIINIYNMEGKLIANRECRTMNSEELMPTSELVGMNVVNVVVGSKLINKKIGLQR